jgi:hypothetical protein
MQGYYPGSKKPLKSYGKDYKPPEAAKDIDLGKPKKLGVSGKIVDFYTVGTLAFALNRRTVTIRKWETEGIIPKASFILPSSDTRGQRRLYTEAQILGLRELARQEGLLNPSSGGKWASVEKTEFKSRAFTLFKELEGT